MCLGVCLRLSVYLLHELTTEVMSEWRAYREYCYDGNIFFSAFEDREMLHMRVQ